MNKWFLSLGLVIMSFVNSIGQNTKTKEALVSLFETESKHFYDRNFKGWASCYKDDASTYWTCIEKGDIVLEAHGWKNIATFVGDYIAANPTPEKVAIERTAYTFKQYGNIVWVTFNEVQKTATETKKLRALRMVEKVNGVWKIVYMCSYPNNATT
jgi:hypothetical protein